MQDNKLMIPGAIIVAGIIIAGAVFYVNNPTTTADPNTDPNATDEIAIRPVDETDHIRGNPNAQLILVEYSDTECPYCKGFHETMIQLMAEYGRDGKIAWVYRHFPLTQIHPKAPAEAEATECVAELAGNDAFWEYLDKIFEITPANNGLDLALLPELAETVGVSPEAFKECVEDDRNEKRVQADFDDALKAGANGTPYTVVVARTGQILPIPGAQPYENVKQIIDSLLAETE